MKTLTRFPSYTAVSLIMLALTIGALSVHAQNFAIDWFTIGSGGGTSTGGIYSASGTIGQPAAAQAMSGGNFSVSGGFWSIVATNPIIAAPALSIRFISANTVVVSWPSPSTGFQLQQSDNLNMMIWVTPSETFSDDGTNKSLIINPPIGNRFYRLFKP